MEYIEVNGVKINIKHFGYTEDDILNNFKLRNLLEFVIDQARK